MKVDRQELKKFVSSLEKPEPDQRSFIVNSVRAIFEGLGPGIALSTRQLCKVLTHFGMDFNVASEDRARQMYWRVYQACRTLVGKGELVWNKHTKPVTFELKSYERKKLDELIEKRR